MIVTGRLLEIATGQAGLPLSKVLSYRQALTAKGYDLPPLDESDPSMFRKAINYTGAVVRHVASGSVKSTEAEAKRRVSVCESNTCGLFNAEKRVCRHAACGCYIDTKATWQEQTCPLGLWDEATPVTPPRHPLARLVTRWAVGVTTAPRQTPTVDRCVKSLKRSGFHPFVFSEPGSMTDLGCPVVQRHKRLGCWRNYVQTLRDLLCLQPNAEAIAVFQDDVVACLDLREFLEHDLWPSQRTGVVSVYSPEEYEAGESIGIDRRKKMILGLQGAVYPRAVAQRLVDEFGHDWRGGHDPKNSVAEPHLKKAADTWVAESISKMGLGVFHYRPSMIQHIDAKSAIGHGGVNQIRARTGKHFRKSAHFVGEDVSVLEARKDAMPWCRWTVNGVQRYREITTPLPNRPVTVVIPGYGCPDLTRECLTHLEQSTLRPSVVYVDDGSTDAEWEEVLSIPTSLAITHIRHNGNMGFTAACNTGIAAADPESHVLLLNNDTRIGPHCIERLRYHAELHRHVGAVGPITGDDGNQSLKRDQHRKDSRYKGDFATDRYSADTERLLTRKLVVELPILSGYCMFMSREALDQIGPLSSAPHLASGLVADDEWCQRARGVGRINLLVYDAWCAHLHKTTFRRQGIDRGKLHSAAIRAEKAAH